MIGKEWSVELITPASPRLRKALQQAD